jgi:hypothetical protein
MPFFSDRPSNPEDRDLLLKANVVAGDFFATFP